MGIVGDPTSLLGDDPIGAPIAALIVEPLVRRTATEDLEPRLAESVPTVENGAVQLVETDAGVQLVATFRIRDGARWHDGVAVEAEDVRSAFERDRAAPAGTHAREMAERIDRVAVIDARSVQVTYRAGERWDLFALAPRALPRHLLHDRDGAVYAARPIHAGPYAIDAYAPGVLVLAAFKAHPIDKPAVERIVVRSFDDGAAMLAALRRGEIDLVPSPGFDADLAPTLDRSAGRPDLQVLYTPAQAIAVLGAGHAFAEPLVREAMALTIDRERIARSVFLGRVLLPASYLVPPLWAASEARAPFRVDREAARRLLAQAGFRRGTFGIAERNGARLVGAILVPQRATGLEEVARAVASDLAVIGIAVDVSARPLTEIRDRLASGELDLAVTIEAAEDPALATSRYRGFVSPWFDVLADAAMKSADRSEKRALYAELQRLWSEDMPVFPLYQVLKVDIAPARLDGIRPASHSAPLTWNAAQWKPVRGR